MKHEMCARVAIMHRILCWLSVALLIGIAAPRVLNAQLPITAPQLEGLFGESRKAATVPPADMALRYELHRKGNLTAGLQNDTVKYILLQGQELTVSDISSVAKQIFGDEQWVVDREQATIYPPLLYKIPSARFHQTGSALRNFQQTRMARHRVYYMNGTEIGRQFLGTFLDMSPVFVPVGVWKPHVSQLGATRVILSHPSMPYYATFDLRFNSDLGAPKSQQVLFADADTYWQLALSSIQSQSNSGSESDQLQYDAEFSRMVPRAKQFELLQERFLQSFVAAVDSGKADVATLEPFARRPLHDVLGTVLTNGIHSKTPEVQRLRIHTIGELGFDIAVRDLIGLLEDADDPRTRHAARLALAKIASRFKGVSMPAADGDARAWRSWLRSVQKLRVQSS